MEDNMNKGSESAGAANSSCKCGKDWGTCGYHRHYALRWLLGVVILLVVFAIGVKVGELRGSFGRYRGGYMMRHYPNPLMRAYPMGSPSGMMGGMPGAMMPKTATNTPVK